MKPATTPKFFNQKQLQRFTKIADYIKGKDFVTSKELEYLTKKGYKTIERDLLDLNEFCNGDFRDVTGERSWTIHNHNLVLFLPLASSSNTLKNLYLSNLMVSAYKGSPMESAMHQLIEELEKMAPDTLSFEPENFKASFSNTGAGAPEIKPEVWNDILKALKNSSMIRIHYTKPGKSKPVKRAVSPYHLYTNNLQWYLVAYHHESNPDIPDFKPYALHRISEIEDIGQNFTRQPFDFNTFIGSGYGAFRAEGEYTVKVRFSPSQAPYIIERKWHDSQKNDKQADGSLITSFTVQHLYEIKRWILSYGADAEVLEPKELRDEVAADVERIRTFYS